MGLDCYNCTSVTNWDDCKQEKVTCPGASDRCIKAHVKYGENIERFQKYCGVKAQCDTYNNPTCKLGQGSGFSACSVNCDRGVMGDLNSTLRDDQNSTGSTAGVSGMVKMACAVVVLVFLNAQ